MIRSVKTFLFYLLLLLLPTQLGRHFFFDFSLVSGIRSDYLAPTFYLTDVTIFLIIGIGFLGKVKSQKSKVKSTSKKLKVFSFFVFNYLLFNALVIASSKWVALYKLLKIIEFFLLGMVIVKTKPRISSVVYVLSIGVVYSSLIAIFQFWQQKSIGGLLYWLGERTFNAASPGIAAISIGGGLFLRSYATFPHPNALGGFLAVVLPLLLLSISDLNKYQQQLNNNSILDMLSHPKNTVVFWFLFSFLIGLTALFLSFSRTAWVTALIGLLLVFLMKRGRLIGYIKRHQLLILAIFYLTIVLSVLLPFGVKIDLGNWKERAGLVLGALEMILTQPIFGVGLNNSTIRLKEFITIPYGLYIFQPVHNVYLLILTELGLIGFSIFLIALTVLYRKILSANKIVIIALFQLFLIGMFDHYLWTLQQGQLLLTVFVSLAFLQQKNYA